MAGGRRAEPNWLQSARSSFVRSKLLTLLLLALRVDALSFDMFQGKLVVLNAPRSGPQLVGNVSYHVRKFSNTGEWVLYSLVFGPNAAAPPPELKTGDAVQLVVDLDQSGFVSGSANPRAAFAGPPGTLYVWSWAGQPSFSDPFSPFSSSVYYTGGTAPLRLSTAVWVVTSVCGKPVEGGLSAQDVHEVCFGPPAGAALRVPGPPDKHYPSMSLSRLLYDCSYGNILLKRSSTLILNLSLPCSGLRPNGAIWNATQGSVGVAGACGNNELWGWMEYALQNLKQVPGVDPSAFRRRVLVLPPTPIPTSAGSGSSGSGSGTGALCPAWQQRGSFGCDESLGCDIWIRGDRSQLLQRLTGQLGSSMLLQPAATATRPLGPSPLATSGQPTDPTCPTGSAEGSHTCFNGPNAYKLLLTQPAARLDATTGGFFVGYPRVVQLPPAALSPNNLLLVLPNWSPPPSAAPRPLYGQYRAPVGGDAGLTAAASGALVLHSVNSLQLPGGMEAGAASVLLATLMPGESYRFEPAKIIVRFQSRAAPAADDPGGVTGGSATVVVCRYEALSESDCYDGADNDCDGLLDFDDPDCAAVSSGGGGAGRR